MRRALVPLVDAAKVNQPLRVELRRAFERVLNSTDMLDGGEVARFESALASEAGTQRAVGVVSATAAVQLVLEAVGIGHGDDVLVPANAPTAIALAIVAAGATPVIVDIDPLTALVDPDAADAAITSRTAAIVAVDAYGQPVDGERVADFAHGRGLFVLEDATRALHAAWDGIPAGALGDAAVFGFAHGDSLGSLATGGAVTTDDGALAERVRRLRVLPGRAAARWSCEPDCRMGELDAALATVTLQHARELVLQRGAAAQWYEEGLAATGAIVPLTTRERAEHAHDAFVVRVPERDRLLAELDDSGIDVVALPAPLHHQPVSADPITLPAAEALAASGLSLPLFPGITEWQVELTVAMLTGLVRMERTP